MLRLSNVIRQPSYGIRGLRFFSQGNKATQDRDLLETLQSEIHFELSEPPQNKVGSLGDFVIEWDSSKSKDVFLRKKSKSGEEVAVSALICGETFEDASLASHVQMKVCIKKPGLSSILQFDCEVDRGLIKSGFDIQNAYYIPSTSSLSSSLYRGRLSCLDPRLQVQLKKYLEARGIEESLLNFLVSHLKRKEQSQYVNWLQKLESAIA